MPFLMVFFIPFLYKHIINIDIGWFVLILPFALFSYFLSLLSTKIADLLIMKNVNFNLYLNINVDLYIDYISLLFALLITGIGSLVILYSIYYLPKAKEKLNNFYIYLLLFMEAMLGIVLSDNLVVLYVFWEITSISSSLL